MIESDTNYSFLIGSMPHLTCASVRALSDRFITDLPEADRGVPAVLEPWEARVYLA